MRSNSVTKMKKTKSQNVKSQKVKKEKCIFIYSLVPLLTRENDDKDQRNGAQKI